MPHWFRRRSEPDKPFALEAPGSRFTLRPAVAIQVGQDWGEVSGRARRAILTELGEGWTKAEGGIDEVKILDGVQGRGAASWVPVVEWFGLRAAGGVMSMGAGKAALAAYRLIRKKVEEARSSGHRVLVSRGLAVALAMEHVIEKCNETELLQMEFAAEPSRLAGRPVTETSYVGLEPWLVSVVNESRTTRYLLVVATEGDISGCMATSMDKFEGMFSPVPPPE